MATTMVEPFAPWLRELNQVLHNQGSIGAFIPPADVLIEDEGVTVYMDVPGIPKPETLKPHRIEVKAETNGARESGQPAGQESAAGA